MKLLLNTASMESIVLLCLSIYVNAGTGRLYGRKYIGLPQRNLRHAIISPFEMDLGSHILLQPKNIVLPNRLFTGGNFLREYTTNDAIFQQKCLMHLKCVPKAIFIFKAVFPISFP
jgi:hypothetical protein